MPNPIDSEERAKAMHPWIDAYNTKRAHSAINRETPCKGQTTFLETTARAADCLPRQDQWWLEAPVMTHPPVSQRSS
jgi:hypothetical protein